MFEAVLGTPQDAASSSEVLSLSGELSSKPAGVKLYIVETWLRGDAFLEGLVLSQACFEVLTVDSIADLDFLSDDTLSWLASQTLGEVAGVSRFYTGLAAYLLGLPIATASFKSYHLWRFAGVKVVPLGDLMRRWLSK